MNSDLYLVHLGYTKRDCFSPSLGWSCQGVNISKFFNNEGPEVVPDEDPEVVPDEDPEVVPDFIDPTFVGETITEGEGTTQTEASGGARRRKTKQTGKKKRKSRAKRRRTRR